MFHGGAGFPDMNISQGRVATRLRYGGTFSYLFIGNLTLGLLWKNFDNRSAFCKVIGKNVVAFFPATVWIDTIKGYASTQYKFSSPYSSVNGVFADVSCSASSTGTVRSYVRCPNTFHVLLVRLQTWRAIIFSQFVCESVCPCACVCVCVCLCVSDRHFYTLDR